MTPTGGTDRDDELAELLRLIGSDRRRIDDADVQRAIEKFYGRPDALALLREVAREERLLRLLHVRTGIGSGGVSEAHREAERRIPSIRSIGSRAPDAASVAKRSWTTVGLAAAAALVVGVALNWGAATGFLRNIGGRAQTVPHTVATLAAELDTVNLPDGSRVILAPNSNLRYAIAAGAGRREVWLEGEAYFDVEHDEDRPFRVRTRHAVVEDLGTSFVVREYAGDVRARVAVRTGSAALSSGDRAGSASVSLQGGEGAYIDSSGTVSRFRGDPESYGTWTSGRLVFDAARLPEVLSTLSHWYGVDFRISDSTLAEQYFTGGVSSASLAQALDVLGPVVHARFERQGKVVVASPRPDGS